MRDILRKKEKTDVPKTTKWDRRNVSIAPDHCFQLYCVNILSPGDCVRYRL